MAFIPVAELGTLGVAKGTIVRVGGQRIALFQVDGEVIAVDDQCPHAGGPVGLGEVAEGVVTCPLHGWAFDLRSGACLTAPGEGLARRVVRIDGTTVLIELDPVPGGNESPAAGAPDHHGGLGVELRASPARDRSRGLGEARRSPPAGRS